MFQLLADTAISGAQMENISTWIGMVGSLGFAVWYGYHVTAVTIPKINADNNALTVKLVSDFRDEMKMERESHSAQMIGQREECKREMEWLMAAFQARMKDQ